MNKIGSSLIALTLFAAPLGAASAQEDATITVDLSTIAPDIATELGIDANDVPTFIDLSVTTAIEVCGLDPADIGDLTACNAFSVTAALLAAIETEFEEEEDDGEGAGNSNPNSASRFAPGQQDGPATEFAPGQQDGPARDFAPGQLKKADPDGDE